MANGQQAMMTQHTMQTMAQHGMAMQQVSLDFLEILVSWEILGKSVFGFFFANSGDNGHVFFV